MLFIAQALAVLASVAAASPIAPRQVEIPENWNWHIKDWEAGGARDGSYAWFNITVPSVGKISGAKAYCTFYEDGYYPDFNENHFWACKQLEGENGVAAKFVERTKEDVPRKFEVSFVWPDTETGAVYNFTAVHDITYNQFVSPPLEFDVTPSSVFGIL